MTERVILPGHATLHRHAAPGNMGSSSVKALPNMDDVDAFISYRQRDSARLARAVERALEQLAKPLLRLRALHVWRDETDLTPSMDLQRDLEVRISAAKWFIFLASPGAAEAEGWCERELQFWLESKGSDRLVICLADGEILWDRVRGQIDDSLTTALPRSAFHFVQTEPFVVDLRGFREDAHLNPERPLRHARFRDAARRIAARIHGRQLSAFESYETRTLRRNVTMIVALVAGLGVALLAGANWLERTVETRDGERSQQLAIEARRLSDSDAQAGLRMAAEAFRLSRSDAAFESLILTSALTDGATQFIYGHPGSILDLAVDSASGSVLALSDAPSVQNWSLATGIPLGTIALPPHARLTALVATDKQELIIAGATDGTLYALVRDGATPTWRALARQHSITRLAIDEHGETLIATSRSNVSSIWDVPALLRQHPTPRCAALSGHMPNAFTGNSIYDAGLSADGKRAVTTGTDGVVILWNTATCQELARPITAAPWFMSAALSPDGKWVVAGHMDGSLRWRKVDELDETVKSIDIRPWLRTGRGTEIGRVAFSADQQWLAVAASSGDILVWKAKALLEGDEMSPRELSGNGGGLRALRFIDHHQLASGDEQGRIVVWSLADATSPIRPLRSNGGSVQDVAFAPEGNRLLSVDWNGNIDLWATRTGDRERHDSVGSDRMIKSLAASWSHKLLAVGTDRPIGQTTVRPDILLFDWPSLERRGHLAMPDHFEASALAFSANGKSLIAGGIDKAVYRWSVDDLAKPPELITTMPASVQSIAVARDGTIAIAPSSGGSIRLFTPSRGERSLPPPRDDQLGFGKIAFHPTRAELAAGLGNGLVAIWDLDSNMQNPRILAGHSDQVNALSYSSDGKLIATGDGRGRVIVWRLQTGKPLLQLDLFKGESVYTLDFAHDGNSVAVGTDKGRVEIITLDAHALMERACRLVRPNLSLAQWRDRLGATPYPDDPCRTMPAWTIWFHKVLDATLPQWLR